MIQTMMILFAALICFALIFVVPCLYVFRGGAYYYGVAIGWIMAVLSVGAVAVAASVMPTEMASGLPRGRDIAAAMGFGWAPGIVASTVGGVLGFIVRRVQKRKQKTDTQPMGAG